MQPLTIVKYLNEVEHAVRAACRSPNVLAGDFSAQRPNNTWLSDSPAYFEQLHRP